MKFFLALILILSIVFTSCATILQGPNKKVKITAMQEDVEIWLNGILIGKTQKYEFVEDDFNSNSKITTSNLFTLKLDRSENHTLEFKKKGYLTQTFRLEKKLMGGYLLVDILFGVIPLVVDASTGSWNNFNIDNSTTINLQKE